MIEWMKQIQSILSGLNFYKIFQMAPHTRGNAKLHAYFQRTAVSNGNVYWQE